jgi:outer membrane protein TolC
MLSYAILACEAFAASARAQSGGLSLQQALDAALVWSAQIRLAERQARIGEGALLAAGDPFDARLLTSFATGRSNGYTTSPTADANAITTSTFAASVGLSKRFRVGVELASHADVARNDVAGEPGALESRANVGFDATLPLLRDRGWSLTSAGERAARHAFDAARLEFRHAAAASAMAAADAYWNYVAAAERLEVYRSSETRAGRLVEDTRILVGADERPAADLPQLLANLALKRAARIAGEQALVDAGARLALATGVRLDAGNGSPRTVTNFPVPGSSDSAAIDSDAAFAESAVRRRSDLAALQATRSAVEVQMRAARDALRPRLDLLLRAGYQGATSSRGVGGALASVYRNVPGIDVSLQVVYELPLASDAAHGEALRSAAALDQARVREAELARAVASGVCAARQALDHGRSALTASRDAVELSSDAVENERLEFALGMSTLFDVILAEDALTSARLSEIAGELAYATAIARLRYESGVLLDPGDGPPTVNAESLMEEP